MTDLKKDEIQRELTTAYWMEMETVMNYVCNSVNLDGVRAEEVKKALATDVQEELGHAQTLARRIRELGWDSSRQLGVFGHSANAATAG